MNLDWGLLLVILNTIVLLINLVVFFTIKFNDLKHVEKDISNIKEEAKNFKKEIKKEDTNFRKEMREGIRQIFLAIRRMEKKQVRRDAICEERHRK